MVMVTKIYTHSDQHIYSLGTLIFFTLILQMKNLSSPTWTLKGLRSDCSRTNSIIGWVGRLMEGSKERSRYIDRLALFILSLHLL